MASINWNPSPVSDVLSGPTSGSTIDLYVQPQGGGPVTTIAFFNENTGNPLSVEIYDALGGNILCQSLEATGLVRAATAIATTAITGNLTFSSLNSPNAAVTATDTTISHKIPVVLNGVTYYIALTTGQ